MAVTLTETAAERVRNYLENRGKGEGLRLGVKTTGCSGMAYVVDYADDIDDGDQVFESFGVKVVVDKKSMDFVDGTQIDFKKNGLSEAFTFTNPNVAGSCGCGESFTVQETADPAA